MKTYISGMIAGISFEESIEKFEHAEQELLKIHTTIEKIINPMKLHPRAPERKWEYYMAVDIAELLLCDSIYMLKCWGQSRGARLEYAIAKEIGLKIYFQ